MLLPFLLVTAVYLTAMYYSVRQVKLVCKPLLVATLLLWFLSYTQHNTTPIKKENLFAVFALLFCMLGDTFLMFNSPGHLFFLLGLSSFLAGHLFFIVVFARIKGLEKLPFRWYYTALPPIYFIMLTGTIAPASGTVAIPVVMYAAAITAMLVFALHLIPVKRSGATIAAGATLFVISDSFIAIDKFVTPIPQNHWFVMLTYLPALFLITFGLGNYFRDKATGEKLLFNKKNDSPMQHFRFFSSIRYNMSKDSKLKIDYL